LEDLRQHGKVALWGGRRERSHLRQFAGPGVLVAGLRWWTSIRTSRVDLSLERPIRLVAPGELAGRGIEARFDEPNYHDENERLLARAGIDVDLIDWNE